MWSHCSSSGDPLVDSGISSGIVIHSALKHDGAARELLVMMKYRSRKTLSGVIADLFTEFADELPGPGDIVVPLPLGKQRERERGFNQSYLIAKYFCRNTGASLMKLLIREDRHPQVGLNSRERRDNIEGAYSVIDSGIFPGLKTAIWLLDDVATTGSSMHAAALALKDSGFSRITGITFTYRSIDSEI